MASDEFKWIDFPSFGGGLNTLQDPAKIADNEVAHLLNFEFDASDSLKARNGFDRYNTSPDFISRITSIFGFSSVANGDFIIATTATQIYKDVAGNWASIKGALVLPNNTYWKWVTFFDLAIGVNGDNGAVDDIVKWSGAGNAVALTLTGIAGVPTGAYTIEVFNSRLFVVFTSHPNRLYYSTLGDPEDWATSGGFIEVGYNDGDKIQGIHSHKGRLFIFKRNKIYQLITELGGKINTDVSGWSIDLLAGNIGCISQFSIQSLLDDIVFLCDEGVASINAVQQFGDFEFSIISRKVEELSNLNLSINTFASVIFSPKSLYLLSVPDTDVGTVNNIIYVLDYKGLGDNKIRWTRFKSNIINVSAMGVILLNRKKTLFLGGDNPNFFICKWNLASFSDINQPIVKEFKSKAFSFDNRIERKQANKAAIGVNFSNANLSASVDIILDQDISKTTSYTVNLNAKVAGGVWDVSTWDVDKFSFGPSNKQIIERKIKGEMGNRFVSAQIQFTNQQLDQDIVLEDIGFAVGLLTSEND